MEDLIKPGFYLILMICGFLYSFFKVKLIKKFNVGEKEVFYIDKFKDAVSLLYTTGTDDFISIRKLKKSQGGKLTETQKKEAASRAKILVFDLLKGPAKDLFLGIADERKDRWVELAVNSLKPKKEKI